MKYKYSNKKGFTLLEVLIVIGILAVLSAAVLVAVNPTRQFKLARDSQRIANVSAIANAISQNMSEHKGVFMCDGVEQLFDEIPEEISSEALDIAKCLVPDYIASIPFDPSKPGGIYKDKNDYKSNYTAMRNNDGRIVVGAAGEIDIVITTLR
jgi:type IV pilus assembly protein PilA